MNASRQFDRTLRVVMWCDAFLSVALVVVCLVASPIVAAFGVPGWTRPAVALAAVISAVLLAAFGAITAVVLMIRMRAGDYLMPRRLRLPLPGPMRPDLDGELVDGR